MLRPASALGLMRGAVLAGLLLTSACAATHLRPSGALGSYSDLHPVHTATTKALWAGDPAALARARSVRIAPVRLAPDAGDRVTPEQAALIANELARTLCVRLENRFDIVAGDAPADLTVRAVVTGITPTNTAAATASMGVKVVASVVGSPIAPRVPLGLGSFSAEGEATDAAGRRRAALVWTRGASALLTGARVSHIGDAYQLAGAFAGDLARLVSTGENPLKAVSLPPLGRKNAQAACAAYGHGERSHYINGVFGIAPEATDKDGPTSRGGSPTPETPH